MGLPPVVVGLFVSIFLWRSGPLGFSRADLFAVGDGDRPSDHRVADRRRSDHGELSESRSEIEPAIARHRRVASATHFGCLCKEARLPLLAAVMAGFGGVISEVGASMMVGGNIRGQTRVLTTATVLETGKGNFDVAIALSLILADVDLCDQFFLDPHSAARAASVAKTLLTLRDIVVRYDERVALSLGPIPRYRPRRRVGDHRSERRRQIDPAAGHGIASTSDAKVGFCCAVRTH